MNSAENQSPNLEWLCHFVLMCVAVLGFCITSGCDDLGIVIKDEAGAKVVDASSRENVLEMFRNMNSECPVTMDEYTKLVRVDVLDDHNIEFRYVVNQKGRNIVKQLSKDWLRDNAIREMKKNKTVVAVADKDLSIQHIYEDHFGGHVLSYTINKQALNGNPFPIGSKRGNPFLDGATPITPVSVDNAMPQSASKSVDLPQKVTSPRPHTNDNPAGVADNPYFDA